MKEVSLDKIVTMVVQEVVKELSRQGVRVVHTGMPGSGSVPAGEATSFGFKTKTEKIEMGAYKSPVLTEHHVQRLHELTGEIVIPRKTVVTPKARAALTSKKISVSFED